LADPKKAAEAEAEIFRNPVQRRAWVNFQLKIRGLSFAALARQEGVVPQAVSAALASPSRELEEAIAAAVERPVEILFPERFIDGRRIAPTRDRKRSSGGDLRNVQIAGAR
jgi:lambda repressor-like predicted transcriptional regulator